MRFPGVARSGAEALGTAFVVIAYPETQGFDVVTTNSAVALRPSPNVDLSIPVLLTLTPGQLGHYEFQVQDTIRALDQ